MLKKYVKDLKAEFAGYNSGRLVKDLLAGITVAAVALPLALAFGISSGADAAAGLVTAIIGGFIMSLTSGASYQISGPTGAMTAILITVIARYSMQGMFITCLLAGLLLLLAGVFRLGRLVDFIPTPVITGFTSGIALVIAFGQIDNFFGVHSAGESTLQKLLSYGNGFSPHWASLIMGAAVVAVMLLWPKSWGKKVPASLAGIVLATLAAALFSLSTRFSLPTVGGVPQSILLENRLHFSGISLAKLPAFFSPALSVALLAMIESLLCASSAARMKKEGYDADRELLSQGVGNLLLPFFGGVPATAAIARTSVVIKSGGQTRLAGMFHSVILLACVLLLSPVFQHLPLAALSGVLMVTAFRMNDWENIRQYFGKKMKGPIFQFLVTMAATVVFDLTVAILLGIAAALVVFVINASRLAVESAPVESGRLRCALETEMPVCENAGVVYIAGPLFFMNAQGLLARLQAEEGYKTLLLSIRGVPLIDVSAVGMLSDYCEACRLRGVTLHLCGAQKQVLKKLESFGLLQKIGPENIHFSVDRAIALLSHAHGAQKA